MLGGVKGLALTMLVEPPGKTATHSTSLLFVLNLEEKDVRDVGVIRLVVMLIKLPVAG